MYAIISKADGFWYTTVVFGMYDTGFSSYFIVLNKEKTALVKEYEFDQTTRHLVRRVFVTDCSLEGWNLKDNNNGQVSMFDNSLPLLVDKDAVDSKLTEECKRLDASYVYNETVELRKGQDIKNLDGLSFGFHDAYISAIDGDKDNLHVIFKGVWGCSIEFLFKDCVSYRPPAECTEEYYWYSSSMYFKDGFFCLINEEDCTLDSINKGCEGFVWFMARHAEYRVVVDK